MMMKKPCELRDSEASPSTPYLPSGQWTHRLVPLSSFVLIVVFSSSLPILIITFIIIVTII